MTTYAYDPTKEDAGENDAHFWAYLYPNGIETLAINDALIYDRENTDNVKPYWNFYFCVLTFQETIGSQTVYYGYKYTDAGFEHYVFVVSDELHLTGYASLENNKQVENLDVISDEDQIQIQFYYADGSNEEIFVDISGK